MSAAKAGRIAAAAKAGRVFTLVGRGATLRVTAVITLGAVGTAVVVVVTAKQVFGIGWAIGTVAEGKISDVQWGLKQYDKEVAGPRVFQDKQEPIWVVRAGVATPEQLKEGVDAHLRVPGLTGFSVQSSPGKTIKELAAAGRFPNAQISVTTTDALLAVGVRVVKSPGEGYHHTAVTEDPLMSPHAEAISSVFKQQPNPAPVKR
jgi:uncharacterized protein (DUF697 family)